MAATKISNLIYHRRGRGERRGISRAFSAPSVVKSLEIQKLAHASQTFTVSIGWEITDLFEVSGSALAAGITQRSRNRWLAPYRSLISRAMLCNTERFLLPGLCDLCGKFFACHCDRFVPWLADGQAFTDRL